MAGWHRRNADLIPTTTKALGSSYPTSWHGQRNGDHASLAVSSFNRSISETGFARPVAGEQGRFSFSSGDDGVRRSLKCGRQRAYRQIPMRGFGPASAILSGVSLVQTPVSLGLRALTATVKNRVLHSRTCKPRALPGVAALRPAGCCNKRRVSLEVMARSVWSVQVVRVILAK